jgi:hypothetical protein
MDYNSAHKMAGVALAVWEVTMRTFHPADRLQPMWPGSSGWLPIAVAVLVLAVILAILEFLMSPPVYAG